MYSAELADALDLNKSELEQVEAIHGLCQRHGLQVEQAAKRMITPFGEYPEGSLKTLLWNTDLGRPPVYPLAYQIGTELDEFIRRSFSKTRPQDENDLNAKIDGFLSGHRDRFQREHPCLSFATARTIPDHSDTAFDLLIESKYIRGSTSPSKATEGIAADLTKYSADPDPLKLFIVYDPENKIVDRSRFKRGFESMGNNIVWVV